MAYGVSGVRRALHGGGLAMPGSSVLLEIVIPTAFAVVTVALATYMCARRGRRP